MDLIPVPKTAAYLIFGRFGPLAGTHCYDQHDLLITTILCYIRRCRHLKTYCLLASCFQYENTSSHVYGSASIQASLTPCFVTSQGFNDECVGFIAARLVKVQCQSEGIVDILDQLNYQKISYSVVVPTSSSSLWNRKQSPNHVSPCRLLTTKGTSSTGPGTQRGTCTSSSVGVWRFDRADFPQSSSARWLDCDSATRMGRVQTGWVRVWVPMSTEKVWKSKKRSSRRKQESGQPKTGSYSVCELFPPQS